MHRDVRFVPEADSCTAAKIVWRLWQNKSSLNYREHLGARVDSKSHLLLPWPSTPIAHTVQQERYCQGWFRKSSFGSMNSRPSGPMAVTWLTYSPDFAQ